MQYTLYLLDKMPESTFKYQNLIAPCGMNCGLCIGYLRKRKPCGGCFKLDDKNKPKSCRSCGIANCEKLAQSKSGFCYECKIYPCARLKRLNKRYRSKYGMSMLENLNFIEDNGVKAFLSYEEKRWTCSSCGKGLCVHREVCLECGALRLDK